MEKKQYTTPEITLLGDVEEMTKGIRLSGRDDQFFLHRMGGGGGGGGGGDPTSGSN